MQQHPFDHFTQTSPSQQDSPLIQAKEFSNRKGRPPLSQEEKEKRQAEKEEEKRQMKRKREEEKEEKMKQKKEKKEAEKQERQAKRKAAVVISWNELKPKVSLDEQPLTFKIQHITAGNLQAVVHETVSQTPVPVPDPDPIPAPHANEDDQTEDVIVQKSARYLEIQRRVRTLMNKQALLEKELLKIGEEKLSLLEEEEQLSVFLFCK